MKLIDLFTSCVALLIDGAGVVIPSVDDEGDDIHVTISWDDADEGLSYDESFWFSNIRKVTHIGQTKLKIEFLSDQQSMEVEFLFAKPLDKMVMV